METKLKQKCVSCYKIVLCQNECKTGIFSPNVKIYGEQKQLCYASWNYLTKAIPVTTLPLQGNSNPLQTE